MYEHVPRKVRFTDLCAAWIDDQSVLAVLPSEVTECLKDAPSPRVLTDFAGRDSVAAAMRWLEDNEVGTLIPVGDVVPTRYGDWSVYQDNWQRMKTLLAHRAPNVLLAPWFVLEDIDIWRTLSGRYASAAIQKFGFHTPCLGCHLHFYVMRIVLAEALNASTLLSGEKELHGSRRKANQTEEAVQGYAALSSSTSLNHVFPIHKLRTEEEMRQLLPDGWQEGDRQLRCVMSGNDRDVNGELAISSEQVAAYMQEFAVPMARHVLSLRREGASPGEVQRSTDATAAQLLSKGSA